MGSIISAIELDIATYKALCKVHNEKPQEVYSEHYYWLKLKNIGLLPADLTYEKYYKQSAILKLNRRIKSLREEIDDLREELKQKEIEKNKIIYNVK